MTPIAGRGNTTATWIARLSFLEVLLVPLLFTESQGEDSWPGCAGAASKEEEGAWRLKAIECDPGQAYQSVQKELSTKLHEGTIDSSLVYCIEPYLMKVLYQPGRGRSVPNAVSSLVLALDERPPHTTLTRWLYEELRSAVLDRRLPHGMRLPATRDFAAQYGISRGTVVTVFEQLEAEGYLIGVPGRALESMRT